MIIAIIIGTILVVFAALRLRHKTEETETFFYLDKNDEGYIKNVPKGVHVDGVKLTEDDLKMLRETGKLDISDRKNFKSNKR
jgi:hypothetical protein